MFHRILIVLGVVSCALFTALSPTDGLACGQVTKEAADASWKAAQTRNIRALDDALPNTKLSDTDLIKVNELRAQAAKLSDAGKLADADQVLREAWKTLGHPKKFVGQPVFPMCGRTFPRVAPSS